MFKHLNVLVTGGTSTFGRAAAERFLKHEAKVLLCDHPASNGEQVAKEIGQNVSYMPADVAKEIDVINLVKEAKAAYGGINVLVNCAQVEKKQLTYDFEKGQPLQLQDFQSIMNANVVGTLNVIRICAPILASNTPDASNLRGTIINVAHAAGVTGGKENVLNAAASSAIIGMNRSLARDLGIMGIRVLTIVPNSSGKRDTSPSDFAHMVQTCIVNTYLNATKIQI